MSWTHKLDQLDLWLTDSFIQSQQFSKLTAHWRGKLSVNNGLNCSLFLTQSQPKLIGKTCLWRQLHCYLHVSQHFQVNCPVSCAKNTLCFIRKRWLCICRGFNMVVINSSLEIKCLVSGAKMLMLYCKNNAPPTLNG